MSTSPTPGSRAGAHSAHNQEPDGPTTWEEVQDSPDFQAMRRSFRRFVFPMTVAFLVWYFLYVLLAAYATEFFATPVLGNINVGLLFGLGQFLSTALITIAYIRWANRNLDRQAAEIGAKVRLDEGEIR